MYFATSLTTLLAATALAAPAPAADPAPRQAGISFKAGRSVPKTRTLDGVAELSKARRKFGIQTEAHDANTLNAFQTWLTELENQLAGAAQGAGGNGAKKQPAAKNATTPAKGEVAASPSNGGGEFLEKVKIGNQQFDMDFDTGSSNLWVFSTNLNKAQIGQHTAYNGNQSATFQAISGGDFQISYGDASSAAGTVGRDDVTIGGLTVKTAIGVTDKVSAQFVQDANNDGLVGLAFDSINTVTINGKASPQKTWFSDIQSQLQQPLFSVDLSKDGTGSYEFGNIDNTRFTGQLAKVPVNSANGFWQFTSNFATVDGKKVQGQSGQAIADTGTSLLLVDDDVAVGYYQQVQGAQFSQQVGGFVYPCSAKLPEFGVDMGGAVTAKVPGNQITFQKLTQNFCFGGVQPSGGSSLQIYGDTFFQANYVVFDNQGPQLQVAAKA